MYTEQRTSSESDGGSSIQVGRDDIVAVGRDRLHWQSQHRERSLQRRAVLIESVLDEGERFREHDLTDALDQPILAGPAVRDDGPSAVAVSATVCPTPTYHRRGSMTESSIRVSGRSCALSRARLTAADYTPGTISFEACKVSVTSREGVSERTRRVDEVDALAQLGPNEIGPA